VLILLSDAGCRSADALAAAASSTAWTARCADPAVAAGRLARRRLLRGRAPARGRLGRPSLLEALVSAPTTPRWSPLAERLDQARHLHLRPNSTGTLCTPAWRRVRCRCAHRLCPPSAGASTAGPRRSGRRLIGCGRARLSGPRPPPGLATGSGAVALCPLPLLKTMRGEEAGMPYVIAEPCIGTKDASCVEVCPVDCIYEGEDQYYIHPDECIDCGACEPECPVTAIFPDTDVPPEWTNYIEKNRVHFEHWMTEARTSRREVRAPSRSRVRS
jgi:ferredoxin